MSDTGKAAMSREEAERLIAKAAEDLAKSIGKGGANVNLGVQDQRFTKLIAWVWVSLGMVGISTLGWGINRLDELNLKVGILISQREQDVDEKRELRNELQALRREVYEIKARVK